MAEAEINNINEEILEIFSELSLENQQTLLSHARITLANESSTKLITPYPPN